MTHLNLFPRWTVLMSNPTARWDYITTLLRCAARHDVSAQLRWAFWISTKQGRLLAGVHGESACRAARGRGFKFRPRDWTWTSR